MIRLINTQRTLQNLHRAINFLPLCKSSREREELEEVIDCITSILALYLREHTPEVSQAQYKVVNTFNDYIENEVRKRLA